MAESAVAEFHDAETRFAGNGSWLRDAAAAAASPPAGGGGQDAGEGAIALEEARACLLAYQAVVDTVSRPGPIFESSLLFC
jgi:hypothetical protein